MSDSLKNNIGISKPLVSVYTCVYNGERTLHRVFESMKRLNYPNIEHIIVDDGSTDKTPELIEQYIKDVDFPVVLHRKPTGGKHTALNVAWSLAKGYFSIQLDADDELLPHSISYLVDTYYSIPEDIREDYWCVHGRCVDQYGNFVGDRYPDDINSDEWRTAIKRASKCGGEKIGLQVTKCLSEYRFPEVKGVSFIPEGVIWMQMRNKYGIWFTNEVVRVYYINEGGNLTDSKLTRKKFGPMTYYHKWMISHPDLYSISFKTLFKYSLMFFISDSKYRSYNKYFEGLENHKFVLTLLAPFTFCGAIAARILKKIK